MQFDFWWGHPEGAFTSEKQQFLEFWDMLSKGICTTTGVPGGRWNPQAWVDKDHAAPNMAYTSDACWLPDCDQFDVTYRVSRIGFLGCPT